ncbi:MAG: ATP-binding protein [bacterium]|nr:ATP-binding protein [bacterium]
MQDGEIPREQLLAELGELRDRCAELERQASPGGKRASRQFTEDLFGQVPEAVVFADKEGVIRQWTEGSEKVFGYTSEEAVGHSFNFLFRPDVRELVTDQFVGAVQEIDSYFDEVPCLRKDGVEIPVQIQAKKVYDEDGNPVGLMGSHRDMSIEKKQWKQLGGYLRGLETKIEDRTENLEEVNRQLRKEVRDRKRAEEEIRNSNQRLQETLVELKATQQQALQQERLAAIGQLAAGISHDFNNLLTVMMGFAQLLEMRTDIPESAREELQKIFSQGERAAQLIRQILDFSRETSVSKQPVDVVSFLNESVKLLARTLPESIRVVPDFACDEAIVEANLTQIYQVITNLSVNSEDAMPEGGELKIGVCRVRAGHAPEADRAVLPCLESGSWVLLSVSDTGTGMAPDVQKRIYEPFFTTKAVGEGTGLGLAQVYGIVKQHGGEITVNSTLDRGTTFRIYFPEYRLSGVAVEQEVVRIEVGHGETLLLVEDDPEVRGAVQTVLERLDYRVVTAINGYDALEVYELYRSEISLVITDMVMPEMGGIKLYEALRERGVDLPIVFMSGYPVVEDGKVKLPGGLAGFVEKPHTMAELASVIHEGLNKSP